ncbi:phenylacetate--CoA ligase family protein [Pseudonocardia endophytica]|uniref:Phenylacetate-CoA ligase n=1 Tax=Pseudonocardia endophytica TaxID=401976 RepID=A0A4R1HGI4_PSEEN|nr:AMP-binding protein [Pseudonocardia endophytica]TCK20818.1 phenylacetate-CoA ligase [Pseudonocardia endophytica]
MAGDAMEEWHWPAGYDQEYLPDPDSPYWFPNRETMDPEERDAAILERLPQVIQYAYDNSPFYKRKYDEAGLEPKDITTWEAFSQVPVVVKEELRQAQIDAPPFGDYGCIPDSEVHHIHGTSGTTGTPTGFAIGRRDWEVIADNHARILWGMGVRPGDTVFVSALFSLYLGSWGAMSGAERLRCKVFPYGAGASGMTSRALGWLARTQPKAFYATPSYALRLAEVAEEEKVDPREFGIKIMFFSGEPGASVPAVRNKIEKAFDTRVVDCGTMAEMTPFMSASATDGSPDGMLLWQDIVYHEICDPDTYKAVPYGDEGTPVYTHLERTSQPMIRLLSKDLSRWEMKENGCGRTYPSMPVGVYGRIDDMIHIRGENVYPTEIDNVLREISGYGGEHRVIVTRTGSMDEIKVRAEYDGSDTSEFEKAASSGLHRVVGLRVGVEVVEKDTFERSEHKANRVVDEREHTKKQ